MGWRVSAGKGKKASDEASQAALTWRVDNPFNGRAQALHYTPKSPAIAERIAAAGPPRKNPSAGS